MPSFCMSVVKGMMAWSSYIASVTSKASYIFSPKYSSAAYGPYALMPSLAALHTAGPMMFFSSSPLAVELSASTPMRGFDRRKSRFIASLIVRNLARSKSSVMCDGTSLMARPSVASAMRIDSLMSILIALAPSPMLVSEYCLSPR